MSSFSKKFLITATALVSLAFAFPALAQYGLGETQKATGGLLPTGVAGKQTIPEVVGAVVSAGLGLIGVVFFLLILYSGFSWMIAMGNSEKVSKAKEMLEAAIIGLVIILASYAISTFVFTSLAGGGGGGGGGGNAGIINPYPTGPCTDLGGTCGTQSSCVSPAKIITGQCPGGTNNVCCIPATKALLGGSCILDNDCASPNTCVSTTCTAPAIVAGSVPLNGTCQIDADCTVGNVCTSNKCAAGVQGSKKLGESCFVPANCETGLTCYGSPLACMGTTGYSCTTKADCVSDYCNASNKCDTGLAPSSSIGPGGPCRQDSECGLPNSCVNNECGLKKAGGGVCAANSDCVSSSCVSGKCSAVTGEACSLDSDCVSNSCNVLVTPYKCD